MRRRALHRLFRAVVVLSLLTSSAFWASSSALAISCSTTAFTSFNGNYYQTTSIDGATASIEYINEALCTGFNPSLHGGSFSSSWVAIEGDTGNEIFQVGYDKCQGPGCPQQNSSYFFWAEGWDQSPACGPAAPPVPHKAPKGNATAGLHLFTVIRTGTNGVNLEARIDGAVQRTSGWNYIIAICWNGVVNDAAWTNEVYNFADQTGGLVANAQNWEGVQYHKGSWTTRTATSCNVPGDFAHQKCSWASSPPGKFWTWDTRY